MSLSFLLWTVSLVMSVPEYPNGFEDQIAPDNFLSCDNEDLNYEYEGSTFLKKTTNRETDQFDSNSDLPDSVNGTLLRNLSCVVDMQYQMSCSWATHSLPDKVHYSASVLLCDEEGDTRVFDCVVEDRGEAAGWQGYFDRGTTHAILRVNVSFPKLWYIHTEKYKLMTIEKPNPPNITVSIKSENLEINWETPLSMWSTEPECSTCELSVNGEIVRTCDGKLNYTETNIDVTRTYAIKMRVKGKSDCGLSQHWSDWSEVLEIAPSVAQSEPNPLVIAAITLGLPMILLALMLLCKFQRVFERLFPPIPSPSMKIKLLLEKDVIFQVKVVPSKCIEEITEVAEAEEEGSRNYVDTCEGADQW